MDPLVLSVLVLLGVLFFVKSRDATRDMQPPAHEPRRDPHPDGPEREPDNPEPKPRRPLPGIRGRHKRHSMYYVEYLRSPEWTLMREQILRRAGYRCEFCKAPGPLQVHHLTYRRLGRELPEDLRALCKPCHDEADRLRRRSRWR